MSAGKEYLVVPTIDLTSMPEGQGFLIHPSGNNQPIYGNVVSNGWPIVRMRKSAVGERVGSWLHVPVPSRVDLEGNIVAADISHWEDTRPNGEAIEKYYMAMMGLQDEDPQFVPGPLIPGQVACFLELDRANTFIRKEGGGLSLGQLMPAGLELELPLAEGVETQLANPAPYFEVTRP